MSQSAYAPSPYVIAVRAPGSGISQLEKNDWMVVSEPYVNETLCKQTALKLLPFVTSKGKGDIAVYNFDVHKQQLKGAPRLIGRNGAAARAELPEDLTKVLDYDEVVKTQLEDMAEGFSGASGEYQFGRISPTYVVPVKQSVIRRTAKAVVHYLLETNARALSAMTVMFVVAFGTAIVVGNGLQRGANEFRALASKELSPAVLANLDVDSKHIKALRNGAMEVVRHNRKRPGWMQLVRIYPTSYGAWVDVLSEFPEIHYRAIGGAITPHTSPWRTPEQIPKKPRELHDPFNADA